MFADIKYISGEHYCFNSHELQLSHSETYWNWTTYSILVLLNTCTQCLSDWKLKPGKFLLRRFDSFLPVVYLPILFPRHVSTFLRQCSLFSMYLPIYRICSSFQTPNHHIIMLTPFNLQNILSWTHEPNVLYLSYLGAPQHHHSIALLYIVCP